MSLLARTFRGAAWSAAGSWTQVALNLAGVAIIARSIGPGAYGTVGLAMVVSTLVATLAHTAFVQAIVQRAELRGAHVDATLKLVLALSLAGAGLLWVVAPALGTALEAPDGFAGALRALGLLLPGWALVAVMGALLERELRFRELATVGSLGAAAANATGIALALSGAGLWALVAMDAVRCAVSLVGLGRRAPWRVRERGGLAELRELSRFNLLVLATQLLGRLDELLPRALIGALLGPTALGCFLLARRVFDELSHLVTGPLAGVAMAAAARAQGDVRTLHHIVLGLYRAASTVALPCFLGAIVVAPVAVPLAFGEAWRDAVPVLQVLLLCGLRTATGVFNVGVLRGLGRPDLPLWLLGAGALLNALLIPALAPWGVAAAAGAVVIRTFATWPLGCLFVRTASGLPIRDQLRAGGAPLAAALLMAAGTAALDTLVLAPFAAPGRLAGAIAGGALIYAAAIGMLAPDVRHRARALVGARLAPARRTVAAPTEARPAAR